MVQTAAQVLEKTITVPMVFQTATLPMAASPAAEVIQETVQRMALHQEITARETLQVETRVADQVKIRTEQEAQTAQPEAAQTAPRQALRQERPEQVPLVPQMSPQLTAQM